MSNKKLPVHGCLKTQSISHLNIYGSDEEHIKKLIEENNSFGKQLIDRLPYTIAEVIWAVRNEMARTVEDVLARRIRMLFLDAKAAIEAAPAIAEVIAAELNYDEAWRIAQLKQFTALANGYLVI